MRLPNPCGFLFTSAAHDDIMAVSQKWWFPYITKQHAHRRLESLAVERPRNWRKPVMNDMQPFLNNEYAHAFTNHVYDDIIRDNRGRGSGWNPGGHAGWVTGWIGHWITWTLCWWLTLTVRSRHSWSTVTVRSRHRYSRKKHNVIQTSYLNFESNHPLEHKQWVVNIRMYMYTQFS